MAESLSCSLAMNWEQSAWPWMSPLSVHNIRWALFSVFYMSLVGGFSLMIIASTVSWIFLSAGRVGKFSFFVLGERWVFYCVTQLVSPASSLRTLSIFCSHPSLHFCWCSSCQVGAVGTAISRHRQQQQCGLGTVKAARGFMHMWQPSALATL